MAYICRQVNFLAPNSIFSRLTSSQIIVGGLHFEQRKVRAPWGQLASKRKRQGLSSRARFLLLISPFRKDPPRWNLGAWTGARREASGGVKEGSSFPAHSNGTGTEIIGVSFFVHCPYNASFKKYSLYIFKAEWNLRTSVKQFACNILLGSLQTFSGAVNLIFIERASLFLHNSHKQMRGKTSKRKSLFPLLWASVSQRERAVLIHLERVYD